MKYVKLFEEFEEYALDLKVGDRVNIKTNRVIAFSFSAEVISGKGQSFIISFCLNKIVGWLNQNGVVIYIYITFYSYSSFFSPY